MGEIKKISHKLTNDSALPKAVQVNKFENTEAFRATIY